MGITLETSDGLKEWFYPVHGRFEHWNTFEETGHSIFTEDYFKELYSPMFFRINDKLFHLAREYGGNRLYKPHLSPDTYELILKTEDTIEFTVTGHYYSGAKAIEENSPTIVSYPINHSK